MSGLSCAHKLSYGNFSEKLHQESLKRKLPIDGIIELTLKCNLKCGHCYCSQDPARKELSAEEIFKIIDHVTEAGCLWLGFTGGEVFLRKDFLDIYLYAKSKGLLVSLMTNGTLLDSKTARYLGKYKPFQAEITLYGITEETNAQVTGVKGMLKRTLAAIKLLKENKIPLNLKTTVTKDNVREIWRIKKFARSLNLNYRFDAQIHGRIDGAKNPWQYRLSPDEVVELDLRDSGRLKEWRKYCQEFWGPIKYGAYFYCGAMVTSFQIDPYGRLIPCVLCRSESENLFQKSFLAAWKDLNKKVSVLKPDSKFGCVGCSLGHLCDHCPGWAEVENGTWEEKSEYLCKITHLRQKYFLQKGVISYH